MTVGLSLLLWPIVFDESLFMTCSLKVFLSFQHKLIFGFFYAPIHMLMSGISIRMMTKARSHILEIMEIKRIWEQVAKFFLQKQQQQQQTRENTPHKLSQRL